MVVLLIAQNAVIQKVFVKNICLVCRLVIAYVITAIHVYRITLSKMANKQTQI